MTRFSRQLISLSILIIAVSFELSQPSRAAESTVDPQAFLGSWEAKLGNGRPVWLIVEAVNEAGEATVVYGLPKWGQIRQFEQRLEGTIQNGVLQLALRGNAELTVEMLQDNTLQIRWARGDRNGQWRMMKVVRSPHELNAAVNPRAFLGSWESTLRNGRPVSLIIETVNDAGVANVGYRLPPWGRFGPVDQRRQGTITGGVLNFALGSGAILNVEMLRNNTLRIHWARGARESNWRMTKTGEKPRRTASLGKCKVPMPNVIIIPPEIDVPKKFAVYSGIWHGRWSGVRCSRLAIDLVEPSGKVRYVYGIARSERGEGRYWSGYASVVGGELAFGRNTFRINANGSTLVGKSRVGRNRYISMQKLGSE